MAASGTPSDLPAWLRDAVPYEPPAAAALSTEDLVEPLPNPLRPRDPAEAGGPSSPAAISPESVAGDDLSDPAFDGDPRVADVGATDVAAGGTTRGADEAGAADSALDDAVDPAFTSKLVQWSRSAATGVVLSGIAGGLQRVFEPDERPAIVMEVPAPAPDDLRPVRLVFVPGDPKASIAFVRPWLLRSGWPPRG